MTTKFFSTHPSESGDGGGGGGGSWRVGVGGEGLCSLFLNLGGFVTAQTNTEWWH